MLSRMLLQKPGTGVAMKLYAPNVALFVIAGCLAKLGVLAAMPIALSIPALGANSSWYIFLAWFVPVAGSVVPGYDKQRVRVTIGR
jgi:hypothetical protein